MRRVSIGGGGEGGGGGREEGGRKRGGGREVDPRNTHARAGRDLRGICVRRVSKNPFTFWRTWWSLNGRKARRGFLGKGKGRQQGV